MYKKKIIIDTFEGNQETLNIESVAYRKGCFKYYFKCKFCKNQSIADDGGTQYSCNNWYEVTGEDDNKIYCKNYELDPEYKRKTGDN